MKVIVALFAVMFSFAAAAADHPIVGTWNLVETYNEVIGTGARTSAYGEHPDGVIIFTREGRLTVLVTPAWEGTPSSTTAPPRNFLAASGPYTIKSDTDLVYRVDVVVNPSPKGVDRPRTYKISGDMLTLTLPTTKRPDGTQAHTVFTWKRGK